VFKYYFNPFRPLFKEVEETNTAFLNSLQMTFSQLLTLEETVDLLDVLYTTGRCFGKFSLYNKWMLTNKDIPASGIYSKIHTRMNYCAMKVVNICPRCKRCEKCSAVSIPLDELIKFWDDSVFKTKAQMFRKET